MEALQGNDHNIYHHNAEQPHRGDHYNTEERHHSLSIWHWLMWLLQCLTSQNFGIFLAFLVIALIHFKRIILDFCHTVLENGLREAVARWFLDTYELSRTYYHISFEFVWSLPFFLGSTERISPSGTLNTRPPRGTVLPPLVVTPLMSDKIEDPSFSAAKCVRLLMPPSPSGSSSSSSSYTVQQSSACLYHHLEPAFLIQNDYPVGWLVYHPALGVVPKEEADAFDQKYRELPQTVSSPTASP